MAIKAGLVGLPNVGKSSLFNALTNSSIPAENYPFCTVDPHIAITTVPDKRTYTLQSLYESKQIIPATVTFVDIAGLVKGAASGEGLGNQFLSHIRETDLIIHVLRCFEDPDIIRIGDVDPISDYEVIMIELALKDIDSIEKRLEKAIKLAKTEQSAVEKGNLVKEIEFLQQAKTFLENHDFAVVRKKYQEQPNITVIPLLVAKEYIIVANVSESDMTQEELKKNHHVNVLVDRFGKEKVIPACVRLEYELSQLPESDRELVKQDLGLGQTSLEEIIKKTYQNLNLITFFTCGPQEIHSWPIQKGTTVKKAAGEIHSDLEKGFICAEVLSFNDLLEHKTPQAAKQAGKVRIEGAGYIVQDGDIILVRFNK